MGGWKNERTCCSYRSVFRSLQTGEHSMSTSVLYHAFGLRGYRYVRTSYLEGFTVFRIEPDPKNLRCAACGSREVVRRGSVPRTFRTVPIGGKGVLIELEVPRLGCACGAVRQAELGFADPRRRHMPRACWPGTNIRSPPALCRGPTTSLWLPRPRVLQAENLCHPPDEVRISRMNPNSDLLRFKSAVTVQSCISIAPA